MEESPKVRTPPWAVTTVGGLRKTTLAPGRAKETATVTVTDWELSPASGVTESATGSVMTWDSRSDRLRGLGTFHLMVTVTGPLPPVPGSRERTKVPAGPRTTFLMENPAFPGSTSSTTTVAPEG